MGLESVGECGDERGVTEWKRRRRKEEGRKSASE
jgi:hypothetical protein